MTEAQRGARKHPSIRGAPPGNLLAEASGFARIPLISHVCYLLVTMGPKKRSPPSNPPVQQHPSDHPGEADPSNEQLSPSQPKGKRRRQPRDSDPGPGVPSSPVQSSTQRNVDPSLSSLAVPNSPQHSSEGTDPESNSRRQSTSSTMRTSSIPIEGPSTQTPTGRISKAKKGKRVHACSFEGCGKVSQTAPAPFKLRSCAPYFHVLILSSGLHSSRASTAT